MDHNIKALEALEKLVNEATSQTLLKPDLTRMRKIAEIVNSSGSLPK